MELAQLAAKQKRLQHWGAYLESSVHNEEVKLRMTDLLKSYRNVIARCWETSQISAEDANHLDDLERELEECDELARLLVTQRESSRGQSSSSDKT